MRVNLKFLVLLVALTAVQTSDLLAQKFGYTNSAAILVELPETKTADTQINSLSEKLTNELIALETKLQEQYQGYMTKANQGLLTPVEMQTAETELQAAQQKLQESQYNAQAQVQTKREELYGPILEKVQVAIDAVGKENGYDIIFDVSAMNVILFADESEDVTALIKAKL